MNISVYDTGHEIADTIAKSLVMGMEQNIEADVAIGYGILRGMAANLRKHKYWFELDRGYFNPGHYDGYYRISYKGTQARYDAAYPISKQYECELKPTRPYDKSKPILVCPPTDVVMRFFGLDDWPCRATSNYVIRHKGNPNPINWDDYSACITFNSSVGWQALINGIPCISDPHHSVVGSYYNPLGVDISLDEYVELFNNVPRKPLLDFMSSHQFTLAEISRGDACSLINYYLSNYISAGIQEKPLRQMSVSIPSPNALQRRFQSNI
jgi:hypothetical protein